MPLFLIDAWVSTYFVIAWVVCMVFTAVLAALKGHGSFLWILLGLIFGPLALLFIGFMPSADRILPSRVPCPYCAERILPQAIVCRYCGRDLH